MSTSYACVIVAEDDEDDALLLSLAWQELALPNSLVVVKSGEELLGCLKNPSQETKETVPGKTLPGLIILDWHLPRLTGVTLLSALREPPAFRQIPILVLTGHQPPPEASNQGWGPDRMVAWEAKATSYGELLAVLQKIWKRYFGAEDGGPTVPLQELDGQA